MFTGRIGVRLGKMMVLAALAGVAGCQTHRYSKVENDVYGCADKFSRKIPKGFVYESPEGGYLAGYHDPQAVFGREMRGKGRIVIVGSGEGVTGVAAGYADLDATRPWLEGKIEDLKGGSLVYFGYLNAQSGLMSGEAVVLVKDTAVAYARQGDEWRRIEAEVSNEWFIDSPFAWHEHLGEKAGEIVSQSQVDRYIKLAERLSKTYPKEKTKE